MHIAIAGNIGSGKTTLTKMLTKKFNWIPKFEPVDNNPYLEDFYQDMVRWSFHLQVFFLNKRFKEVLEISQSSNVVVQDRTIFEDAYIFAANLRDIGKLSARDYETYTDLFSIMTSLVKLPDLMIYIRTSVPHLMSQIRKRGRDFEQTISQDYLQGLNDKYEKWIAQYPGKLIIVDGDHLDFEHDSQGFEDIAQQIQSEIGSFQ